MKHLESSLAGPLGALRRTVNRGISQIDAAVAKPQVETAILTATVAGQAARQTAETYLTAGKELAAKLRNEWRQG